MLLTEEICNIEREASNIHYLCPRQFDSLRYHSWVGAHHVCMYVCVVRCMTPPVSARVEGLEYTTRISPKREKKKEERKKCNVQNNTPM